MCLLKIITKDVPKELYDKNNKKYFKSANCVSFCHSKYDRFSVITFHNTKNLKQ